MRATICRMLLVLGLCALGPVGAETVLITGANQGIGLEFAKQYAAKGWVVIATHRRSTTPDELAKLMQAHPQVRVERMDVSKDADIKALSERLKGQPIDLIINNAALIRTDPLTERNGNANQKFGTLDYGLLDDFVHVNIAGPLKIAEAFVENVRASKLKKIIAISSAAGMVSQPPHSPVGGSGADHYWYRITKAGLNSAMRLLAVELQDDGITVAMFHPGGVQVESFGEMKIPGMITPEEAIGKMIKTIDGLTLKDTGRFLRNDGRDHPW